MGFNYRWVEIWGFLRSLKKTGNPIQSHDKMVQLQHHARHQLPTFQLIFVHVIESLVFVPVSIHPFGLPLP
ncbi:hypothetical protein RchiOBHm_Chr6g0266101 [Rosa chinensis]|uniref:Uncharacterized protein n=1 Tax=Rosa chinensis TaxID=74649 RepID=A0A2P6PPK4_ROSCH|nr:hypothetical protein RchiOBHm_Chr6g0266101 [Rosa chinensis]